MVTIVIFYTRWCESLRISWCCSLWGISVISGDNDRPSFLQPLIDFYPNLPVNCNNISHLKGSVESIKFNGVTVISEMILLKHVILIKQLVNFYRLSMICICIHMYLNLAWYNIMLAHVIWLRILDKDSILIMLPSKALC